MEGIFLQTQGVELGILYALQGLHSSWLDPVMIFFTTLGDNGIIWILIALFCISFKKSRKCGVLILITLLFCLIVGNEFIKNLVARPRPFQLLEGEFSLIIPPPSEYSFPSGHTMHGFGAATMIFLHNRKAGIAALLGAAVIAFSRMYLFVHFPTDIIGGLIIGVFAAVLVYIAADKVLAGKENLFNKC